MGFVYAYPNLAAEMARKGITITELSKELGVTRSTLYEKLKGKIRLSLEDMQAIKAALNDDSLTLDYLFEGVD